MSFRSFTLLFSSVLSMGALAGAQEVSESERRFGASDTAPTTRPISQREFADAASRELGFLGNLRSWRDTLRGGGRRDFGGAKASSEGLKLSFGGVAPGEFGGGAGVAARWNRIEIGSTAQPQALDALLARFDSYWTGERVEARDPEMQLDWLRAQVSESKDAQIEVALARASRDLPDSSTQWRSGEFARAGQFSLAREMVTRRQLQSRSNRRRFHKK